MEKVDQDWSQAISPDIVVKQAHGGPHSVSNTNRVNITRKLQSIVIDKVNFDKLDIGTVIQFLTQKSKELDPDHQGINFVLRLSSNTPVGCRYGGSYWRCGCRAGACSRRAPATPPPPFIVRSASRSTMCL